MRTVRHSVKQPDINAKTMRNQNNKIAPNIQETIIVPILPKNHRQCAKTQYECTRMRSSHNQLIASLYIRNAQCIQTTHTVQTSINHHLETALLTTTIRCATSAQNTAAIYIHDDVDGTHSETTYYRTIFLNLKFNLSSRS